MRDRVTRVFIIKALIIGHPGVGKTSIRCLLLGLPPPPRRNSTPIAARAARAISFFRLKANGNGIVTWAELDDNAYLKFIADEVKLLRLNPDHAVPFPPFLSQLPMCTVPSIEYDEDVLESRTSMHRAQSSSSEHTASLESQSSSLLSSLCLETADNAYSATPKAEGTVFDIVHEIFADPKPSKDPETKNTFVHLIDSGGQPSFISLVPAFVKRCTVNIVASKLNYRMSDKLQYEYVKDDKHLRQPTQLEQSQLEGIEEIVRTLSSVKHSKVFGAQFLSEAKFLLIGTHADKHRALFDESLAGKNRYLEKSLGELKSLCIEVSPNGDILFPINTRIKRGRTKIASTIRQKIMDACSGAGVDIPTRWYVFELEVSSMAKKKGRSILSLAECIEVGKSLSMGEEDVTAALVFLDDAALCLYFKDAAPHLVFTDPQAILSEVTEILNLGVIDVHFIASEYPLLADHMMLVRKLRNQGLFTKKLAEIACSEYRVKEEGMCHYLVDDLLAILEYLLIIAPVTINGEEMFFIPSILPTCRKISPLPGKLVPLVLLCRTRVIPLGMFVALVVAMLNSSLFSLHKVLGRNAVNFKCKLGGVVLLVECHAWFMVHFNGNKLAAPHVKADVHHAIATVCKQRQLDTDQIVFTDGFICPFKQCESTYHPCEANSATQWLTCSVNPDVASGPCKDERMLAWLAPLDGECV